jgi:LacI family transcriptional regulator
MIDGSSHATADARPTMKHVAALAGVGVKTVSRVMNNEPNVSQATIARVMDAVGRLNYELDVNAGNLKRADRRTMTIGLVLGSVTNPFSGLVHRAIEEYAWERGTAVYAASLDDDATRPEAREETLISAFLRRRVDGLILTTTSENQSYLGAAQRQGTKMVFVDRQPVGLVADAVLSDNRASARSATEHLLAHGHRRIAYLGDKPQNWTSRERLDGFSAAMRDAAIPAADAPIENGVSDVVEADAALARLLARPHPPTAVFAAQNLISLRMVKALRTAGVHQRIALIGFDDFPAADLLDPGLTVVSQNPTEIGRLAAERMFARIGGDTSAAAVHHVPTTVVPRGSGEIPPPSA